MLDKSNSDSRTKALSHWSIVRDAVFGQNQDLLERIKSFPLNPLGWRAQYKHKEPLILQHGMIFCCLNLFNLFYTSAPEVVVQRCSVKKLFLKTSENSQKNTCARVSLRRRSDPGVFLCML